MGKKVIINKNGPKNWQARQNSKPPLKASLNMKKIIKELKAIRGFVAFFNGNLEGLDKAIAELEKRAK